jgi:hypothetical protein
VTVGTGAVFLKERLGRWPVGAAGGALFVVPLKA